MTLKPMSKFMEYLCKGIFWLVFILGYGAKVHHRDRVPKEGAFIVAPNHTSNFDPPLLGMAMNRPVYLMAKEELFRNPIFGKIITEMGAFPLRRGTVDKVAIRNAMSILKRGDLLGIFPQGTRAKEGTFEGFHDGMASLALRTGVPIIPVTIIGSSKMKRNGIHIIVGEPIPVEKDKPTKEAIEGVNEKVQAIMKATYLEESKRYGLAFSEEA